MHVTRCAVTLLRVQALTFFHAKPNNCSPGQDVAARFQTAPEVFACSERNPVVVDDHEDDGKFVSARRFQFHARESERAIALYAHLLLCTPVVMHAL